MAGEHLQKITHRAKQLKKHHPNTKWTNLVKMAAAELRNGKKVSGTAHKTKKKMATKTTGRTVVVAGHHNKKAVTTRKSGRRVGSTSGAKMKLKDAVFMSLGGVVGGSVGAILYKFIPGHGLVKGGVQYGAGVLGMTMIPQRNHFMLGLANGVATGGGVNMLHGSGVMAGVEDMVSGLFDGMSGLNTDEYHVDIPQNTAGNSRSSRKKETEGIHEGDYVGTYGAADIDKWVFEGVPPAGGNDWL